MKEKYYFTRSKSKLSVDLDTQLPVYFINYVPEPVEIKNQQLIDEMKLYKRLNHFIIQLIKTDDLAKFNEFVTPSNYKNERI